MLTYADVGILLALLAVLALPLQEYKYWRRSLFTSFTSTKVQILTQKASASVLEDDDLEVSAETCFTSFTSTKVQILTQEACASVLEDDLEVSSDFFNYMIGMPPPPCIMYIYLYICIYSSDFFNYMIVLFLPTKEEQKK
jgi:hypothetical protein